MVPHQLSHGLECSHSYRSKIYGIGVTIMTEALGSILTTRFLLTLRGVYVSNRDSSDSSYSPHPSKMSDLNFANTVQVVGNLGAPLAYLSQPGPDEHGDNIYDEDENEELFYISSNPLFIE
ncbi:hypothetical protein ABKN59_006272 [Abortiporus biennis]